MTGQRVARLGEAASRFVAPDAQVAQAALEVTCEHMEGTRFRQLAHFVRWRDDRTPESCTYEQVEQPRTYALDGAVRKRLANLSGGRTISRAGRRSGGGR